MDFVLNGPTWHNKAVTILCLPHILVFLENCLVHEIQHAKNHLSSLVWRDRVFMRENVRLKLNSRVVVITSMCQLDWARPCPD